MEVVRVGLSYGVWRTIVSKTDDSRTFFYITGGGYGGGGHYSGGGGGGGYDNYGRGSDLGQSLGNIDFSKVELV